MNRAMKFMDYEGNGHRLQLIGALYRYKGVSCRRLTRLMQIWLSRSPRGLRRMHSGVDSRYGKKKLRSTEEPNLRIR